jgi:hypothetical protein
MAASARVLGDANMTLVRSFIAGLLWGIVLTLVATVWISKAYGAEPYVGADGQWHQHNSKWEGLWIAQDFPSCCGERDCSQANKPDGELLVKRLENGSGYLVQWKGQEPEFVPYTSSAIKPSQDGEYWGCFRIVGGTGVKSVRCLFVPPLGF